MADFFHMAWQTIKDIFPIALIILIFQVGILRRRPAQLRTIVRGVIYAILGLVLFRLGLESTLIPIGSDMATQLILKAQSAADLASSGELGGGAETAWWKYLWLVLFAAAIGLAATLIEPTLMAIGNRVQELTAGELQARDLRLVVASGVALGLALGTMRIVLAVPFLYVVIPMLILTTLFAIKAPRSIVPLALDTGPMATSVVTVPLITAFGVAVARTLPNRDPLVDGFGLVFFALLTPVLGLLVFSQVRQWQRQKKELTGD